MIAQKLGAPVMPLDEIRPHIERVVRHLGEFDPVYVVTGDTDFKSDEAIRYYEEGLSAVCELAPNALRCMHINRANRTIPERFIDRLDFYMYQPAIITRVRARRGSSPRISVRAIPKSPC